jgi:hypothetical protein
MTSWSRGGSRAAPRCRPGLDPGPITPGRRRKRRPVDMRASKSGLWLWVPGQARDDTECAGLRVADDTQPSRGAWRPSCADRLPFRNIERAQGRPGARRPHGPRANKMHGVGTTGSAETSRPSLRDGFNAYIALSSVHRAFWPPSSLGSSPKQLGISVGMPGPHDFTSAPIAFVLRDPNVHRIPASRVVTIARNAPLIEAGCVH